MGRVNNWQLGREMDYTYDETRPQRQVAAIFDINKCIACQTCTMGCKTTWTVGKGQEYMWWNNVETKPWGSYPLAWDVKTLELMGTQGWRKEGNKNVYTGKTIFEAAPRGERAVGYLPMDIEWAYPNRGEDETNEPLEENIHWMDAVHAIWNYYLPRLCNHCSFPACIAACPRKAIYKRSEDGIVLIDQQRCRGYRECVKACPYKKPMYNHVTRVSEKCIFCYPAVEQGVSPRCMRTCIGKVRMVGTVNTPDNVNPENPIDYLVHVKKIALPLYPQYGLEPNMYYIPPIHVPTKFTRQMFGPGVDEAIETYRRVRAGEEPEIKGILMLNVSTDRLFTRFKVTREEAIGYDGEGTEVVRVALKEPTIIRKYYDASRDVYRHNIT